jgi:hypothetical protein
MLGFTCLTHLTQFIRVHDWTHAYMFQVEERFPKRWVGAPRGLCHVASHEARPSAAGARQAAQAAQAAHAAQAVASTANDAAGPGEAAVLVRV